MPEILRIGAAYIRVSDDRQDEYSPDSQLKLVREYAKKNNYYIPDEFVFYDDGISAKSSQKRTEFNKMIALAKDKTKPFEAIFVWKFSRFARNQEESIVYKSLLRKNGVAVISISEPVFDGVFGSLIERIIEWMDEYYLINLSTEVKRGMLEKATRGEAMCRGACGYDLVGKTYVPNDDAHIVRQVFNAFANGTPTRTIAQSLISQGVKTSHGNPPDNRWVEYMLHNPVYIGKIRWSKDGRTVSKRDYDNPNTLVIDSTHEPIIPMELWERVQEILKDRKEKSVKYRRDGQPVDWMLKGLLRCSCCGSTLVRQATKTPSAQCHKYARGQCATSHSIAIYKANRILIDTLKQHIYNLSFSITPVQPADNVVQLDIERLISAEKRKLKRVKEAYENGADTLEEYKENKKRIEAQIQSIKEQATKHRPAQKTDIKRYTRTVENVLNFITDDRNSEQAKNAMLKTIIKDITYNKSNATLDIHFI